MDKIADKIGATGDPRISSTTSRTANTASKSQRKTKAPLYTLSIESLSRIVFSISQKFGFHITRNDFYSPIPDTRTLSATAWSECSDLPGVDMNEGGQLEYLESFQSRFRGEYDEFPREKTSVPHRYYVNNHAFESVDGEILYCMIRHFKPCQCLEIGSGNSTFLAAQAVSKNATEDPANPCELIAVDPYASKIHQQGFPGLSSVLRHGVQEIPLSRFQQLGPNDVLFIDSSHVVKVGSDVQYLFLEVLPRLQKGVVVHVHDIFLPAEYPKDWVMDKVRFWNEQYLLQAFLAFNDTFEVIWGGNYMHLKHPGKLEQAFSSYSRETRHPGSFWMRKIK
jgi:hypothetical protein